LKGGYDDNANTANADKKNEDKYNIPMYKEPRNNPMIPNEQRRIFNENKPREVVNPNQILNLQLYQPPKPKPAPGQGAHPNPAVFYPNYVPNPYDPASFANYMQYTGYNMQQAAPVYKEYNINISGVSGSHIKTAMLFEDSLPIKNVSGTFNSIGERVTMYESIRSVLFTSGDGKDVPIESDSYNLLSHLKIMDINPYNASRYSKNPYKGLPFGFLLYRSCYPIRHDTRSASAVCAQNSTGVNVRIYRLTEGSYMLNKQAITKASDYDEWRDIACYNYIKEHIIKKKLCPHFPIMYGYNIAINSCINFDELKMIQAQGRTTDVSQFAQNWNIQRNPQTIRDAQNLNTYDATMIQNKPVAINGTMGRNQMITNVRDLRTGLVTQQITNIPTPEQQIIALNKYAGKALVCLTEAPNYSIIGWAKKEYRADGNIKTMINSGYHTKSVWESIIFQLLVALYVMQNKGIIINNFRLDRNVFIKDINIAGNVTNYWKYKIEGIEYYVPNYGYLLLVDSNYRDFDQSCDGVEIDPNRERKLDGAFLDVCKLSVDQCIDKTFNMFRSAMDPNTFDQDFVNDNGVKPPEEILRLLANIKDAADAKPTLNISYYIRQFMTMFLNNRVGGPLTDAEINSVKKGAVKEFRKGQIVVMTDQDGTDKFVIHVKQKADGISRIITKDKIDASTANFIEKDIPTSSLSDYSSSEQIKQNFKMNESNLSEEALLETYTVE
jgi:hypothetical protein